MATIAIGDIHGNRKALQNLLEKLLPEMESGDELVFLGDYIDRGPDTFGCIETILKLQNELDSSVICLMGNHEDWMLRSYRDPEKHSWIVGMEAFETISSYSPDVADQIRSEIELSGIRIITEKLELQYHLFFDALPKVHLDFFLNLKLFYENEHGIFVHGGLDPVVESMREQDRESLLWGKDGFPEDYRGELPIVYGHSNDFIKRNDGSPLPRITNGKTFGIDTISSGVLTAIRLPDYRIFQSSE
jgi:serine/threonine protein phosphatase 1